MPRPMHAALTFDRYSTGNARLATRTRVQQTPVPMRHSTLRFRRLTVRRYSSMRLCDERCLRAVSSTLLR
jgi:hypothetical protein